MIAANRGLLLFLFTFDRLWSLDIQEMTKSDLDSFESTFESKVLLDDLRVNLTLKFVDFCLKSLFWSYESLYCQLPKFLCHVQFFSKHVYC